MMLRVATVAGVRPLLSRRPPPTTPVARRRPVRLTTFTRSPVGGAMGRSWDRWNRETSVPAAAATDVEELEELLWFSGIGVECVMWPEGKRPDALTVGTLMESLSRDELRAELRSRGQPHGKATKAVLALRLLEAVECELEEVLRLEIGEQMGEERRDDDEVLQRLKDDLMDRFLGISANLDEEEEEGVEEQCMNGRASDDGDEGLEGAAGDGAAVAASDDNDECKNEGARNGALSERSNAKVDSSARRGEGGGREGEEADVLVVEHCSEPDSGGQHMNLMLLATPDAGGSPFLTANAVLSIMHEVWVFNAGEDLQRHVYSTTLRNGDISRIFVSSMHVNHVLGLQGLLCTISSANQTGPQPADRRRALQLFGPPGLAAYVDCVMETSKTYMAMPITIYELADRALAPFEMQPETLTRRAKLTRIQIPPDQVNPEGLTDARQYMFEGRNNSRERRSKSQEEEMAELAEQRRRLSSEVVAAEGGSSEEAALTWTLYCDKGFVVTAARCGPPSSSPFFAYCVQEPTKVGKLDVEASDALGIPRGKMLSQLKDGECVEVDGATIHPSQVVGPDRPGRKLVAIGEVAPPHSAVVRALARGCDILLHAAQYAPNPAVPTERVSCAAEVGEFARGVGARGVILTYLSTKFHFDRFGKNDDLTDEKKAALEAAAEEAKDAASAAFGHPQAVAAGLDQFEYSIPRREV